MAQGGTQDPMQPIDAMAQRGTPPPMLPDGDVRPLICLCDTPCIPQPPGCDPPPPPPLPPGPAGVYFTSMTLRDLGEYWTRGEPEIEVHIFGTEVGYYYPVQIGTDVWAAAATSASREVWMDCAGEDVDGYRYFDFDHTGTTSVYSQYRRDALFAATGNFAVIETVTHGPLLLLKRRVQLQPPFHIEVLERDDGKSCPGPPKKYDPTFGVQLTVIPFDWSSIEPWNTSSLSEILNWRLGGNNEHIADFPNITFASLEMASAHTLYGSGADLTIKNEGFSHLNIPPNQMLYP
jgi:hypothetical protein